MLENLLLTYPWVAVAVALAAYAGGYLLGVYEIYLYQTGAKDLAELEGGYYSLTSGTAESIARRRFLTPQFLIALPILAVAVWALWDAAVQIYQRPEILSFLIGGLVLLEAAVSLQYLRNIVLFEYARRAEGVWGKIEYSRRLWHTLGYVELYGFTGLYFLMFVVTSSWFFLGGALACFVTARRRRDWMVTMT